MEKLTEEQIKELRSRIENEIGHLFPFEADSLIALCDEVLALRQRSKKL